MWHKRSPLNRSSRTELRINRKDVKYLLSWRYKRSRLNSVARWPDSQESQLTLPSSHRNLEFCDYHKKEGLRYVRSQTYESFWPVLTGKKHGNEIRAMCYFVSPRRQHPVKIGVDLGSETVVVEVIGVNEVVVEVIGVNEVMDEVIGVNEVVVNMDVYFCICYFL
ncbi:hypothetical protein GOBAR_AA10854 [Gossypium barbadense]|uniref:Uncharacterized protein n=1 Tax=Gossypium barbadense TaxID=3634 RepID=A0A2P5Y2H2_GOSBA|nr:hypothetical protein GOBAR_AA10854 [Gossypium barbadense]